jgi:hypothetical protein
MKTEAGRQSAKSLFEVNCSFRCFNFSRNWKVTDYLEDLIVGVIVLKWILRNKGGWNRIGFIWLRIGTSCTILGNMLFHLQVPQKTGSFLSY